MTDYEKMQNVLITMIDNGSIELGSLQAQFIREVTQSLGEKQAHESIQKTAIYYQSG